MDVESRPLDWYVERIAARRSFTLSRWGDGEWHAVLGTRKLRNCDGHRFTPQLTAALRSVLTARPAYVLGMQPLALRLFENRINEWLRDNNLQKLAWVDADVFHRASAAKQLTGLVAALRSRQPLFVGPDRLHEFANRKLGAFAAISVPLINAFASWTTIVGEADRQVVGAGAGALVAVSAGPPAKIIVDELAKRARKRGQAVTIVDFGSLWDPYASFPTRRYHAALKAEDFP